MNGTEINQDMLENQVNSVYIAIGSNLGNKIQNIQKSIFLLGQKVSITKISGYYETPSWPDKNKPKFVNIVIHVNTSLSISELFKFCLNVEKILGRLRHGKNEPRTCDIDIIDFNMKVISDYKNNLFLPHKSMHKRNFVLIPFYEISRNWLHPKMNIKILNLISKLPSRDLMSIKKI